MTEHPRSANSARFVPHAPPHWHLSGATYMITAATLHKHHLWNTPNKRDYLTHNLLAIFQQVGWRPLAWSVMVNHYHIVAVAPEKLSMADLLRHLHSRTARWLNRQDHAPKRRVWYQYWDKCLTYQTSTYARLHYVHDNPAHHGVVERSSEYPWCSMRWFLQTAERWRAEAVMQTPCDRIQVRDAF